HQNLNSGLGRTNFQSDFTSLTEINCFIQFNKSTRPSFGVYAFVKFPYVSARIIRICERISFYRDISAAKSAKNIGTWIKNFEIKRKTHRNFLDVVEIISFAC